MGEVRQQMGSGPVYISFDIDGLDPSFCPGTGKESHHKDMECTVKLRGYVSLSSQISKFVP